MKKSGSIAVLLAAYNGTEFLAQQMTSIMCQNDVDIHIYLSVDVSSDGTDEFCSNLAKENVNITMLPYGERFGGAARNFYRLIRDVDFCGYDYVALSDQDDIWFEEKLTRAIACIDKYKVDAYSSNVMAFWDDGRKVLVNKAMQQVKYDYFFEAAGPGCTYVIKSKALAQFKCFMLENSREVLAVGLHDWMIYAFFRSRAMLWYIDKWPSMLYRQHASNQVGLNSGIKAFLKRLILVKEKWYRSEVEKIYTLLATDASELKLNRSFLLRHFWQLRRRTRDKLVLFLFVLFGLF